MRNTWGSKKREQGKLSNISQRLGGGWDKLSELSCVKGCNGKRLSSAVNWLTFLLDSVQTGDTGPCFSGRNHFSQRLKNNHSIQGEIQHCKLVWLRMRGSCRGNPVCSWNTE